MCKLWVITFEAVYRSRCSLQFSKRDYNWLINSETYFVKGTISNYEFFKMFFNFLDEILNKSLEFIIITLVFEKYREKLQTKSQFSTMSF